MPIDIETTDIYVNLSQNENIYVNLLQNEDIKISINNIWSGATGSGDMQSSVYDPDKDGVVIGTSSVINRIPVNENISKFDIVTIDGIKSISSNPHLANKNMGIAIEDIPINTSGKILQYGIISNSNWNWNSNTPIYLNGNELSLIPPTNGYLQELGIVLNATTILINIKIAIIL